MPNFEVKSTREQLQEMLNIMSVHSSCSECKKFAKRYNENIASVVAAEKRYHRAEEYTDEEKQAHNIVGLRTRVETVVARRFMLHVIERHLR